MLMIQGFQEYELEGLRLELVLKRILLNMREGISPRQTLRIPEDVQLYTYFRNTVREQNGFHYQLLYTLSFHTVEECERIYNQLQPRSWRRAFLRMIDSEGGDRSLL